MKKLIIAAVFLAQTSVLYAGLEIVVSDTTVEPGETLSLGVSGDALTGHTPKRIQGAWLLVNGPAAIENRGFVIYHVPSFRYYDCEQLPYYFPWMHDGSCAEALFHFFADDLAFISLDWGDVWPVNAALVRNITFTCLAEGDVTLRLVDIFDGTLYDTLVVHQVPRQPRLYHVDTAGGSDSNNGLSRETAFATIQKGIDRAEADDTVLVWPGLYRESINFKGKAITLKSAADAAVIEAPGADAVTFHAGEGPDSVLKNFVIRNSGLAVSLNYGSTPKISNLTVVDNDFGVAAYENSNPDVSNCIFANNRYGDLFGCTARYSCFAGQSGQEPIVGLVSHWKFDEGAGCIAYDSAGNNHGTIHGAQWTAGLFDGALDFDGHVDYVQIQDNDSLTPQTQITVAFWVYNRGGQRAGLFKWASCPWEFPSPGNSRAYGMFIGDVDKKVYLTVHSATNTYDTVWGDKQVPLNQWHHVAATFHGGIASIYVDGQLDRSEVMSVHYIMNDAQPLIIGGAREYCDCRTSVESKLNGIADDVRIYNRALTEKQIQQLYQGGSGGPGPGLYPLFADAQGGDYHLKSEHGRYWPEHDIWVLDKVTSPCIDAGNPADDYLAEPTPNGARINAGAYGGTAFAGRSAWRPDGDVNRDGIVNMLDFAVVADNWLTGAGPTPPPDDNVPPAPNPMTWASPPSAFSTTTISMIATTAFDESGVEYYFECTSGGGHNSNWRDEPIYIDSGLEPNTEYCYRVKARDKSANRNETSWSLAACATTTAPIMVWVYIDDPGVAGHEGFHGYMSKYETTNAQYCEYLNAALASGDITVDGSDVRGANGSNSGEDFVGEKYYYLAGAGRSGYGATNGGAARINWTGSSFTVDSGFENHPVTYVSWYGSTAFCNYYGWRLPTEWEWQAVADYDGSYTYGCGTSINNSIANYYGSTHPDGTTEVGAFGAYGYGMCDMAGNVLEWTENWHDYEERFRSFRGGSWIYHASYLRCSCGYVSGLPIPSPDLRSFLVGFRVVFSQS